MGKNEAKTPIPMLNGEFDYEFLYNQSSKLIFYVVRRLINDEDIVKDIVQDTYVNAFKNIEDLEENTLEDFTRWTARIASNNAKMFLRKRRPMAFTDITGDEFDLNQELEDKGTFESPDVIAHKEEISQVVEEIMDSLPDDQRLCVFMFYFEDKTTKEISEELNLSENTIKSRLRYGREKIKEMLAVKEQEGYKFFSIAPIPIFIYGLKNGYELIKPIPYESVAIAFTPFGKISNVIKKSFQKVKSFLSNPLILTGVIASTVLIGIIGPNRIEEIDPFSKIDVVFEGYDGEGRPRYVWKDKPLNIEFNFDKENRLSNGDIVTLSTKDGLREEKFKVTGLKSIIEIDFKDYIDLKFTGYDGSGSVELKVNQSNNLEIDRVLKDLQIELSKSDQLNNGDSVVVKIKKPSNLKGYKFSNNVLEFVVSGLEKNYKALILDRIKTIHSSSSLSDIISKHDTDINGVWIEDDVLIESLDLSVVKIGVRDNLYTTYSESKIETSEGVMYIGVVSDFDEEISISSDVFGISFNKQGLDAFKKLYLQDVLWE